MNYPLIKGKLEEGGFAKLGLSGIINEHITGFTRVSDEEVVFDVESDNGSSYTVTVTATRSGDTWSNVSVTVEEAENVS